MHLSAVEIREATFAEAKRGYERAEVDAFLRRVADEVVGLHERLTEATSDEDVIRHTLRVVTQAKAELIGEAEAAAAEIRSEATAMLAAERRAIEEIRAQAEQEAEQVIAGARSEAERLVAEARYEVGEVTSKAQEAIEWAQAEADGMRAAAREDAEQLVAAAQSEANGLSVRTEGILADARAEADGMLVSARAEVEEVSDRAEGIVASAQQQADELLAAARTDADDLLLAARAEAEELESRAVVEQQVHQQRVAAAKEALAAVETILAKTADGAATGLTKAKAQLTGAYHSLSQVPQSPAASAAATTAEPGSHVDPPSPDSLHAADGEGEPVTITVGTPAAPPAEGTEVSAPRQ